MDKLLLTLTLLAFSSGVICNVAQNLTEGDSAADSVLPRTKVLDGHVEVSKMDAKSCMQNPPSDYRLMNRIMGAHKLYHQPAVTWNQARKICTADGGDLAVIRSQLEGVILNAWMQKENIAQAWIGIHDLFERDNWVTVAGESLASTGVNYWAPGTPNYPDGNEDCGTLDHSGVFVNIACDHWRSYFCKVNLC